LKSLDWVLWRGGALVKRWGRRGALLPGSAKFQVTKSTKVDTAVVQSVGGGKQRVEVSKRRGPKPPQANSPSSKRKKTADSLSEKREKRQSR